MYRRLVVCIVLSFFWSCSSLPRHYIKLDSGSPMSFNEILGEIEHARVIFAGEIHTDPSSHRVQLEIIKHLVESGRKVSVAIEIFSSAEQEALNRWIEGAVTRRDFIETFRREVNLPFSAYEEIFEYAREKSIPIIGIDAERRFIANVSKKGIQTAPSEFLEKVKYTDCAEEPAYGKMLGFNGQREYHQSGMPYLCDGQRLRDAVMAYHISRIIVNNGSTVVVMLGVVHASRIAVPGMLRRHVPVSSAVLMPEVISRVIKRAPDFAVADYIWY